MRLTGPRVLKSDYNKKEESIPEPKMDFGFLREVRVSMKETVLVLYPIVNRGVTIRNLRDMFIRTREE